ncbi:hypothetical protein [Streptosporangium sp. NPDC002524]|uniref:hypothetical protein n=1 Tax=Streptosporangium sp. NPDC002524 TaxID=3154537 RepID=UPI003329520F
MVLVTAEQVAVRAGLTEALNASARTAIEEALNDAYAEAASYLSRSPVPETFTERGVRVGADGTYLLAEDPVIEVLEAEAENTVAPSPMGWTYATYRVTYRAGLDPDTDPVYRRALARYVAWAAAGNPMVRRLAQGVTGARLIKSVNVPGQGVTYEEAGGAPGSKTAGATPTLEDLDGWRRLVVSQRAGMAPHPLQTGQIWQL